jgi:adenine-specific DNA-methyltransferase
MMPEENLLICCKAYQEPCETRYSNINIKKIPLMLLGRCEFGKDDYSLNIVNVPMENEQESGTDDGSGRELHRERKKPMPGKKEKRQDTSEATLF